ncbi:hypothetical protein [Hymenobacter psychrophilus]|uniref:hypothetical protein n=1 Tax=Hymenobacter psychrophilus TaxID=651662 RepID=UPI0011149DF4|nr:hypothetical protein [Hymenobacter psychrophilus]
MTRPLIKIFASGFYRENTGLLLTLFILIFINFFYTNVLNQTHLTHEELIQNALKLVISSVSEPLGVILLLSVFFIYSLKSWQYVGKRLGNMDVQFLFYSINSAPWNRQLQSWFVTQFIISIPILIIGLYAVIVGVVFGYWLTPFLIIIYLTGIITYGAYHYTTSVSKVLAESFETGNITWLGNWHKPLFSLFLYEIVARKRFAYLVTKLVSFAGVVLLFSVFNELHTDVRIFGVIALWVALSHVILLYQENKFDMQFMRFARNFPQRQYRLHIQKMILWIIVLLPELLWFLVVGGLNNGLTGILLTMSLLLLFGTVLKIIGQRMYYYLRLTFGLSISFLLINLFGLTLPLAMTNIIAAWALLYLYRNRLVMEEA